MTTSGTATYNMDILQIAEEAFERAGTEMRSGYDLRTLRRSMHLMGLEWANRGINLWTIEEGSQALTAGTASYTLPADTIDLAEHILRISGSPSTDYSLTRVSVSTYASRTNKTTESRPTEIYIDRQRDAPNVTLWPVPDAAYTLVYWRIRRIEDLGVNTNNYDIPARFLPALVSGLAYSIAMKKPELAQRVPTLKAIYEEQFELAASEDREKANLVFTPLSDYIDVG